MKLATSVAILSSTLAIASAERDGEKTRTGRDGSMSMADAELSMPEETTATLEEETAAMADDVPGDDYYFSMHSKSGKMAKSSSFSYDFSMMSKAGKGDKECGYDVAEGVCLDGCGVEFGGVGIVDYLTHEECIEFCSFFENEDGYLGREHSQNPDRGEYCACLFEDGKVPLDVPEPIVPKVYPSSGSIVDAVYVEDVRCAKYTCAPKSKAGKCAPDMSYSYDFSMDSKAGKGAKTPAAPEGPVCGFDRVPGICLDSENEYFDTIYYGSSLEISDDQCEYDCEIYVDLPGFLGYVNQRSEGFCGCVFDDGMAPALEYPFTEFFDEIGKAPVANFNTDVDATCGVYKCTEAPPAAGKAGKGSSYSYDFSMDSKAGKGAKGGKAEETMGFQNCTFYNPALYLATDGTFDFNITGEELDLAVSFNEDFADIVDAWLEGASPAFLAMMGAETVPEDVNPGIFDPEYLCPSLFGTVYQMEFSCFAMEYYEAYVNAAALMYFGIVDGFYNVLTCPYADVVYGELFGDALTNETITFMEDSPSIPDVPGLTDDSDERASLVESMSMSLPADASMSM